MFDTTEDSEASDGEIIPGDESQDEDTADDGEIFEADETEAVEPESDALIIEDTIDDPDATDENAVSDDTAVADETTASDETAADETEQPSDGDADAPAEEIAADSVDEFVSEGDFDELPTEDSDDEELFFVDEGEMESVSSEAMNDQEEQNVLFGINGGCDADCYIGNAEQILTYRVNGQDVSQAKENDEVTVVCNYDSTQYTLVRLTWTYNDVTKDLDLKSPMFTMPAGNVSIRARFTNRSVYSGDYGFNYVESHGSSSIAQVKGNYALSANAGDMVSVYVTEPNGWIYEGVTVTYGSTTLNLRADESFNMPAEEVTITPVLSQAHTGNYGIQVNGGPGGGGYAYVNDVRATSANENEIVELRINANYGYTLTGATVSYNGTTETLSADNMSFTMPAFNVTVTPTFSGSGSGGNGPSSGSPIIKTSSNGPIYYKLLNSPTEVGKIMQFTLATDEGWTINSVSASWSGGELSLDFSEGVYSLEMPDGDVTVNVDVTNNSGQGGSVDTPTNSYTVSFENNIVNGSVSSDKSEASADETITLSVTPDSGYELDTLTVTGPEGAIDVSEDGTFSMPAGNVTIVATFRPIDYDITVSAAANGTVIAKQNGVQVNTAHYLDTVYLNVTPAEGYELESLTVTDSTGNSVPVSDNSFTMPASPVTIVAAFRPIDYAITVSPAANGTVIAKQNDEQVNTAHYRDIVYLDVTPAEGYELESLTVTDSTGNNVSVNQYSFNMPAGNVTVTATFVEDTETQPEPQENLLQVHNDTPDWGSVAVKIGGEAVAPRDGGTYTTFFPISDNSQVSITFTPNEGCSLIPGRDISIYPGEAHGEDWSDTYTHDNPFTYTFSYAAGGTMPNVSVRFEAPANTVVIEPMSYPDGGTITVKVGNAEPAAAQSGQSFEAVTDAEITVTVVPNDGYRLLSGGIYAFHAGENGTRNDIRAFDPDGQRVYGSGETASHTFTKTDSVDHVWVCFEPVTNYTVQVKTEGENETIVGEYTLESNPDRFTIREGNYNFIFPSDLHPFGTLTDGQVEYYYDKFNNPMGPAGATSPVTEAVSTYYIKVSTQGSGGPGGPVDPSVDGYALFGGTSGNFNMGDMSNAVKFLVDGQEVSRAKAGEEVTVQINAQWHLVQLVCSYGDETLYLDLDSPKFTMPESDAFVSAWLSQQEPHKGAYKFIYNDSHGCTIIAYVQGGVGDAISANANEYVNLNVYPPQEWIYEGACVVTYGDTTLNLSNYQGFTMPAQDVTITPILSRAHTGQYRIQVMGGMQGHGNAYVDNVRAVSANAGETVELRINANVGYKVTGATLTYNGQTQKLTADNMTFTMPAGNVEVTPEFASDGIIINDENFPDKNLQTTLKQLGYCVHMEGSDYVVSAGMVGYLEVNNVEDYTGLDQFTKLNRLVITGNEITTLTLSNPTLTSVMLGNCENLTSVDLSGCPNLIDLNFEGDTGKVANLDISGCTKLTTLQARGAALTTLDVSKNTELVTLDCNSNQLTELDVSQNTKLESLRCQYNKLSTLNLANNPLIQQYVVDANKQNPVDEEVGIPYIAYFNPNAEEGDPLVLAYDPDVEISLAPTYTINQKVEDKGNGASGTIDAPAAAAANQVVTVTLVPGENSAAGSLKVTFGEDDLETSFADGKYTFTMPEGEVTLTATFLKIPTVTAPEANELTYNGEDQALVEAGTTDGGTLQYRLDGENWNTEIPKGKDAREYSVYYKVEGDDTFADFTAEEPVTVTIAKAPATVKIGNNGNKTKTYGNEDPELTTEGYEVTGLFGDDRLTGEPEREKGENVKRYKYNVGTLANDNYDITVEGTLTIKPKEISTSDIEWSEGPFTYDGKAQLPTATIKSDTIVKWDGKADECDVTVVAEDGDSATDAGEHIAVAVSLSNANYKLEGNLEHPYAINKAEHANVENALEIAISATGVKNGKADLSQCIPESATWSVVECDKTLITAAIAGVNRTLNYTAAPAAAEVTGGWVTIEVEETNYQPYKVTVKFVTSDVFTLSFDSKGGEPVESRRLHAGVPYGELPELKRDFYTFDGWVDSANNAVTAENKMDSGDTTVFAKWEPIVYTVELVFNGHDASPVGYIEGKKTFTIVDEAFDLPKLADVTEESNKVYTFSGWTLEDDETAYADVRIDPAEVLKTVPEDGIIRYTAQWVAGNTVGKVAFDEPDDVLSGIKGIQGMDTSAESGNEATTNSLADTLKQVAADNSKEEIPEGCESRTVTVEMKVSATGIGEEDKGSILEQVGEPTVEDVDVKTDFLKIDITQTTSYTPAEGSTAPRNETTPLTDLNNRVVEIPLNYDMTGRYNLRLFRKHDCTVEEFDKLSARPRNGKDMKDRTFFISGYGGSAVIYIYSSRFSTFAASSDNRESFEVAFDSNGGTKVDTQRVYKGEKVTTPSDPTRAATSTVSYTFDGWYTDAALESAYDFDTPVTAAITLYARWKETAIPVNDTTQDSTKSDSVSPAPVAAAAPAPAPAAAAEPMPTIISNKKNVKATVEVGKVYQIDLVDQSLVGKKYKSSKKKIVTVSATGLVTPKKAGKAKITFKVGKKKRTITLKVVDPTVPKGIQLNATSLTVKKGETQTLTYTLLPEGIAKSAVTWKTSNKKVATVKNGVVTFKKKGKVTITAITKSGKKKAKVKFTVTD